MGGKKGGGGKGKGKGKGKGGGPWGSKDLVAVILKRYTAIDLLNALIIALGVVPYQKKKKKKKKGKGKGKMKYPKSKTKPKSKPKPKAKPSPKPGPKPIVVGGKTESTAKKGRR